MHGDDGVFHKLAVQLFERLTDADVIGNSFGPAASVSGTQKFVSEELTTRIGRARPHPANPLTSSR
jgi:hypothetical protein